MQAPFSCTYASTATTCPAKADPVRDARSFFLCGTLDFTARLGLIEAVLEAGLREPLCKGNGGALHIHMCTSIRP